MIRFDFSYSDELTWQRPVRMEESRGNVSFKLCRAVFLPEGVVGLNSTFQGLLAGGQWFQLWRGEIISMVSPELREFDARIRRGPLADQAPGPRYW